MNSSLSKIQADFQQYLLDKSEPIIDEITSTPKVSAEQRMAVYDNAYRLRLIETLADNFNGLHALAGDQQFEQIARRYIDATPSIFKNIRWYGDKLADFLSNTPPWRSQPVWAEMAMADWHILLAFDAANAQRVDEQAVIALPEQAWTTLRFQFHPSLQRIDVTHNVFKFRKQVMAQSTDIKAPEKMQTLTAWVIWRHELKQMYRSVEVDEAWALDHAISGTTFPELCEGLCEWVDAEHAASRAAVFLKQWVNDGLITQLDY